MSSITTILLGQVASCKKIRDRTERVFVVQDGKMSYIAQAGEDGYDFLVLPIQTSLISAVARTSATVL